MNFYLEYHGKRRNLNNAVAFLAMISFVVTIWLCQIYIPKSGHVIRSYEINGLTYCDYVAGDNSFRRVYIGDVPAYVLENTEKGKK